MEPQILDLNDYCLSEVSSNLTLTDLLNLELTNSRFRGITPYNYARVWIVLDPIKMADYPDWLWRRVGKHIVKLTLQRFNTENGALERLLDYFPNVRELNFKGMSIYNVPNLPKGLTRLHLNDTVILDRCDEWFEQMSPTLTSIEIDSRYNSMYDENFKYALQHLNRIRAAAIINISTRQMLPTFLENNRNSLEKLLLHTELGETFSDAFHLNLGLLSKVTTFFINDSTGMDRVPEAFRAQIIYFTCSAVLDRAFEALSSYTNLVYLTVDFMNIREIPRLVERIPTLRNITILMRVRSKKRIKKVVRKLKDILWSQERKLSLIFISNEIDNDFHAMSDKYLTFQ